jgi:hypothetical protein
MRMGMRRFTRLINVFPKKVENPEAAVALHFMYYNFLQLWKNPQVLEGYPGNGGHGLGSSLECGGDWG